MSVRVTFEEAATVFDDEFVRFRADLEHGERRQITIGMSTQSRPLFVVCVEFDGELFRLISARRATAHEKRRYEED